MQCKSDRDYTLLACYHLRLLFCLSDHYYKPMNLQDYYLLTDNKASISRQQASDFAKNVANDFNPIHDPDNKRFCVPGDLLFALVIHRYGLNQKMRFTFSGLVGNGVVLNFPATDDPSISITGDNGKTYLSIEKSGETSYDPELLQDLICNYVTFSGQTFPHILVPLMAEKGVMINPARPLIIYESMEIDLQRLDIEKPELVLNDSSLDVNGKRGKVSLNFSIKDGAQIVGSGKKNMVLSGLRPYDREQIEQLIDMYDGRKQAFNS